MITIPIPDEAFCICCGKRQVYGVAYHTEKIYVRGEPIFYMEGIATCQTCGTEVYVPHINDLNVHARARAYADMIENLERENKVE